MQDALDAVVEDRAVGDDVHHQSGGTVLGEQVHDAERGTSQERFASDEVGLAKVGDEGDQLVVEALGVGVLERGPVLALGSDGRRPVPVAHEALEVAGVGHGELEQARPRAAAGATRQGASRRGG